MEKVITIFDLEADGLIETATKIHCLSYQAIHEGRVISRGSFTNYEEMREFLLFQEVLCGHNIIRYDIPMIEKFLEIPVICEVIDTLGLSWYLYPDRPKHGLESYGEEYKLEKVQIKNWTDLTSEEYIIRCERDVEINTILFLSQEAYLKLLYKDIFRMIRYINFKLSCLRDQEMEGITLDLARCLEAEATLDKIVKEKIKLLREVMPPRSGKLIRTKPKIRTDSWFKFLECEGYSEDTLEVRDEPSPTSHKQLKGWLDSLGWEPDIFKFSKNTKKEVPQISDIWLNQG